MEGTFFIPQKIKVGYNKREDTYTGKLAYVIYYDQLGVLRKETSWKNWRDSKLGEDDFGNTPTSGFVLNRHAGGYCSGWDHRQSYCRVYDPRGFEIEITIDNLLWILDWSDCYKGKGLDGEFVYGWSGTDLVLIPVVTEDYKKSKEFSDKLFTKPKLDKTDLIPGCSYKSKSQGEVIYIGELKLAMQLGKHSYKAQMFVRKDLKGLFPIDPKSILSKENVGCLNETEISEVIHRFTLTPYSYDFWHSGVEFIKKFIVTPSHSNYSFYDRRIVLSNDRNSIKIFKTFYPTYRGKDFYDAAYPFIELGKSGNIITKFFDLGTERYTGFGNYKYDSVDPDVFSEVEHKYPIYNTEVKDYGCMVKYETTDGYICDFFESHGNIDDLFFVKDKKFSVPWRGFSLPEKIKNDGKKKK